MSNKPAIPGSNFGETLLLITSISVLCISITSGSFDLFHHPLFLLRAFLFWEAVGSIIWFGKWAREFFASKKSNRKITETTVNT